jgi:hypothetical protein
MNKLAVALFALLAACQAVPAYAAAAVSSSTTAVSSLVVKTSPGSLNRVSAIATATGYLLVLDATAAPGDGAIAAGTLLRCFSMQAANTTIIPSFFAPDGSITYINGLVLVFSSTGCFSKTASATAFISASYQ